MPIYEYYCGVCDEDYSIRTKSTTPYSTVCPVCGEQGERVVSPIGYRRDHTVLS